MEGKVVLKVGLYHSLENVKTDQGQIFSAFIKQKFEEKHPGIVLNVLAGQDSWYSYTIDNCNYEKNLSKEDDSFDIVEIDTILLGEVVEKQLLHEIDEEKYKIKEQNLEVAANAVCYKGKYYGVPTLECANFLVEVATGDISPDQQVFRKLLEQGKITFDEFQKVVEANRSAFDDGAMIGNFRGSYTLPCYYLQAYINHHSGENVVQEGIEASLDDETEVLEQMQWYASLGKKENGENPCISPKKEYEDPLKVIEDMRTANHRMVYAYSETVGQILTDEQCQARGMKQYGVICPPLGTQDKLITFTGALVVNKHHYQAKSEAINLFIEFYTSLDVCNVLAKGKTAPNHTGPTYLLMSRKDFYTHGFGAEDQLYKEFYAAMSGSIQPIYINNGLVYKRKEMEKELNKKLGFPSPDQNRGASE